MFCALLYISRLHICDAACMLYAGVQGVPLTAYQLQQRYILGAKADTRQMDAYK